MVVAPQSHATSIKVSIVACVAHTTKLFYVTDPTRECQTESKAPVPSHFTKASQQGHCSEEMSNYRRACSQRSPKKWGQDFALCSGESVWRAGSLRVRELPPEQTRATYHIPLTIQEYTIKRSRQTAKLLT